MRLLGFLFHLYQPPTQHEGVLREVAESCYLPLIKLIKEKKFKATLCIPLSLLEQMDKYGYKSWLEDLKTLVSEERVELVGSAAYHPLLTKVPSEYAEKQIILNEYGTGYYFGKRGDLEGDPSIMLQNFKGFFPPELAINNEVLGVVNSLGYEWVLGDESSLPEEGVDKNFGVFNVKGLDTQLVIRDLHLSRVLSELQDVNPQKFMEALKNAKFGVIALRAETFGYEFDQGITLLENIILALRKVSLEVSFVSDYVMSNNEGEVSEVKESTWYATDNAYESWDSSKDKKQKLQWEILNKILSTYKFSSNNKTLVGLEEIAVWDESELEKVEDTELRIRLFVENLILKVANSDQFISSTETNSTQLFEKVAEILNDAPINKYILPRIEKLKSLN